MRPHIFIVILCIFSMAHTSAFAKVTAAKPDIPEEANIEELFSQAFSYYEEKDFARALLTFETLLTTYPESVYYADAQSSFSSIIHSLHLSLFPEKLYPVLMKEAQGNYTALMLERAKLLLTLYPPATILNKTVTLIQQGYTQLPLRFSVYYVAQQNTPLRYNGPVLHNEEPHLSFSFGNRELIKKPGDTILYFRISSYDAATQQAVLTPLKYLPYRLQQNNHNESLREYSVTITDTLLNRNYQAHLFPDVLTTHSGTRLYGIVRHNTDTKCEFDVFNGLKTILHNLNADAIDTITSFAIGSQQTISDMTFPVYTTEQATNIQRLNSLIDSAYFPHALALYYWLVNQSYAEELQEHLASAYDRIVAQINDNPFPQRNFMRGSKELENGLYHTGWNTLADIADNFAHADSAENARSTLSALAHKKTSSLFVTEIKPIPFPITFMGYNKLSENDQRFQINYKGHSYFMKNNSVKAGYKILYAEEKIIEKINPQLNAPEKRQYRFLHIQRSSPLATGIPLMPEESFSDPETVYCEFKDHLTGKFYPGYILLDHVTMTDGIEKYGALLTPNPSSKIKKELILYTDFDPEHPEFLRKNNTASVKILSSGSDDSLALLDRVYGKNFFTQLKKYRTMSLVEFVETPANIPEDNDSAKHIARSEEIHIENKTAPETKKKSTTVKKSETKSKRVVAAPNSSTDLTVRENQLLHKKRIIKILGILIVGWLCIILIKIFRSFK